MLSPVTARTRVAAVIGSPVEHSLSPAIHNAAFAETGLDWVFTAFPVAPGVGGAAVEAVRVLGLGGLSVTMPHKDAAAAAVDRLSADAAALGAVNCVVPEGRVLVGENTDGAGFLDALRLDLGVEPEGGRFVVLGAGGAARAVIRALGLAGASEVVVVNRTEAKGQVAAALAGAAGRFGAAEDAGDAPVVVNATPVGMGDGANPLAGVAVGAGQVLVDLLYQPAITPLMAAATEAGATVANGLGMLVHQAAHAFTRWTGEVAPVSAMAEAASAALAARTFPGD